MHRSGSSALAGALAALGVGMPAEMLGADADNPRGHFEPLRVIELNTRLLQEARSDWDSCAPFDAARLAPGRLDAYKTEIATLIGQEFGRSPLFALKDPRICRIADLYVEVLGGLGIETRVILPIRHPSGVARSLLRRNGMVPGYGQLLWLGHVLDAERQTRGLRRIVQSYEALLADPAGKLGEAASRLELNWPRPLGPEALQRIVSPKFERSSKAGPVTVEDAVTPLVSRAYAALRAMEGGEDRTTEFDAIQAEWIHAIGFAQPLQDELLARDRRAQERLAHLSAGTAPGSRAELAGRLLREEGPRYLLAKSLRILRTEGPVRLLQRGLRLFGLGRR